MVDMVVVLNMVAVVDMVAVVFMVVMLVMVVMVFIVVIISNEQDRQDRQPPREVVNSSMPLRS